MRQFEQTACWQFEQPVIGTAVGEAVRLGADAKALGPKKVHLCNDRDGRTDGQTKGGGCQSAAAGSNRGWGLSVDSC